MTRLFRLEYEQRKDLSSPLKKLRKKIKEDQAKLKELKKQLKGTQGQEDKVQREFKALNDQKEVCRAMVAKQL